MFANSSLFHFLMFHFSSFNFSWKVCILLHPLCWLWVHHSSTFGMNCWFLSQNASNLKGRLFGLILMSISSLIGQWSEPIVGRIIVSMNISLFIICYDIKNLSSLDATWFFPPFLLFHVWIPFIVGMSTNLCSDIMSPKASMSWSILLDLLHFSAIIVIMLNGIWTYLWKHQAWN